MRHRVQLIVNRRGGPSNRPVKKLNSFDEFETVPESRGYKHRGKKQNISLNCISTKQGKATQGEKEVQKYVGSEIMMCIVYHIAQNRVQDNSFLGITCIGKMR